MEEKLTQKQLKFCQEYIVDFNGTQAAIRAGYSKVNARSQASVLLQNDKITDRIKVNLNEAGLGPDETKKLISDIARSCLNDYFTIRKVQHTPLIQKSLKQLIRELREEIEFEEEFAACVSLSDDDAATHIAMQQAREMKIIRYELELKRNPKATKIVPGQPVLIDSPELDMAKLVADKEKGKIKSITPGQWGTKVEMYAVDTALTNLAKIHGLFAPEKQEITGKNGTPLQAPITFISAEKLTEEQIEKFLNAGSGN
jgi:phage terminase small subunit